MLSYRRGLLIAVCLFVFYYFLLPSHSGSQPPLHPTPADASGKSETGDAAKGKGSPRPIHNPSSAWRAKPPAQQGVKDAAQKPIEDIKKKSLREQLAYQFPYDGEGKFPAYIWQTWKVTPSSGEFEELFRPTEASWTIKHPGFVHEVITDLVALPLLKHLYASTPAVIEAYTALPMAILKADFFRYLILLARGGIYADIDTSALKSALDWVPEIVPRSSYGLVIGIEADPDRPDWHDWYSRRIQFCQWTIQAKPGHPVLREIVASITEEVLKRKAKGPVVVAGNDVIEFSGPARWTDIIFNYFNDPRYFDMSTSKGNITVENFFNIVEAKKVGDVIVLPITSFSAGIDTMNAKDVDDPMAFVKHDFEGTWKPEAERHVGVITSDDDAKAS
ncbi:MAG: Vacuolar protease A [Chaenotheca gracillima]|nr:MAG: Vacuolar protease A [Chaenotheca gracillima]